jgi:steroid delta-isomerase-like uncharacterized protein
MTAAETPTTAVTAVVERMYAAYNGHDVDAVVACWAPDGEEFLPLSGAMRVPELSEHLLRFFAAFPDARTTVVSMTAQGDRVVAEVELRGTFTGASFQGLIANGRPWTARMAESFEVRDGLVRRLDVYMDSLDLMRQIGVMPPQGSRAEALATHATNLRTRLQRRSTRT